MPLPWRYIEKLSEDASGFLCISSTHFTDPPEPLRYNLCFKTMARGILSGEGHPKQCARIPPRDAFAIIIIVIIVIVIFIVIVIVKLTIHLSICIVYA